MAKGIGHAELNISDNRVRELIAALRQTSSSIQLTDLFLAVLSQDNSLVSELIADALPAGFTVADFLAHLSDPKTKASVPTSGDCPHYSDSVLASLREFHRISLQDAEASLAALLICVAGQLTLKERLLYQPLNVDRLLQSFARQIRQPSVSCGPPFPASVANTFPWDDLSERVRRANLTGPSPFKDDPAFDMFFNALTRSLHRSSPRHVMLLRERGVGEQAVLVDLAQRSLRGQPQFLQDKRIFAIDCRRIPLEQIRSSIDGIFSTAASVDHWVLCLDGFANLLRNYGQSENRSVMMALLARVRCRVIAIMSPYEFEEILARDAEVHELFSVISLREPEIPVAIRLLAHFVGGLEDQYRLKINSGAIRRAVVLSNSYILNERLPYKAIKVLRSICDDKEFDRSQLGSSTACVSEDDVIGKIADISGVPAETLSGIGDSTDYNSSLANMIVGQEHAVREVSTELGLIKAGLVDSGKPASVMLFIGQTGTGKTEMAKALARLYSSSKRLKTFTLGNFSEPHSVSGLIGVPPGYVGHDQGGRLVNELNADPYSVFLLDEADKAHPDVMQPFLNLFDEGWIYDQRGVKGYADKAMFILTTNVGQRQIADMCKNGKGIDEITWTMKESLSRIRHTKSNRPVFTPEFLARIKRIVVFRSLDAAAMMGICQKLVDALKRDWLVKRQKTLQISQSLRDAIAQKSFEVDQRSQGKEGGRIVRKLIADLVESPLQAAIGGNPNDYRTSDAVEISYEPSRNIHTEDSAVAGSHDPKASEVRVRFFKTRAGETPQS